MKVEMRGVVVCCNMSLLDKKLDLMLHEIYLVLNAEVDHDTLYDPVYTVPMSYGKWMSS